MLLRRFAECPLPQGAGLLCAGALALMAPLALRAQGAQTSPGVQAPAATTAGRHRAGDTARLSVDIKGMYCASCEQTVRAMLMRTPGVRSATVRAKDGRAVVTYDRETATSASILAAVRRLGYEARIHESGRSGG